MVIFLCIGIVGKIICGIGSLLLAWRVKSIIDVLVSAQVSNDSNFRLAIDRFNGKPQFESFIVGMDEHVVNAQKRGSWLLVFGFIAMALGSIMTAISMYWGR